MVRRENLRRVLVEPSETPAIRNPPVEHCSRGVFLFGEHVVNGVGHGELGAVL
jgi:hypothetical protein